MSDSYGEHLRLAPVLTAAGTGAADTTTSELEFEVSSFTAVQCQLNSSAPAGSPTTPTCDAKLQASFDGANWFDLLTFTQTTDAAVVERKVMVLSATTPIGAKLRLSAAVGTAAGTATYTLQFFIIVS